MPLSIPRHDLAVVHRRRLDVSPRRLDVGEWQAGERFPAVNQLAAELDVVPSTVQEAVVALREEGRAYTVLGEGSFVTDAPAT
ncbi:GntR family transcriptional regulator [Streptomyces sp. NPDC057540]|uniref:GntR family transcriptional regulator n=1 Tax=Streptomyces sp. NPDC057540 TaxID=3346160 RepID=UPI0036B1D645